MSTSKTLLLSTLTAMLTLGACSKSDDAGSTPVQPTPTNDFQIAFANGTGNPSATLVQGVSTLSAGTNVSAGIGYRLESSRTARIFPSADRKTLWSLNYTVGTIEKLSYKGGAHYEQTGRIDASIPLGSKIVRFTKLNEQVASVHVLNAEAEMDGTTYKGHKMELSIGILNLETMTFRTPLLIKQEVFLPKELKEQGYYVNRIDAPVLSGGKLYYGCVFRKADLKNPTKAIDVDRVVTLVVDYNDLSKWQFILAEDVAGSTAGYRTPTQHLLEDGSILQLVSGKQSNGKEEVHLIKLKGDSYTQGFDLNLSALLGGKGTLSRGFFYAGNGIAYIPYEDHNTTAIQLGVDPKGNPKTTYEWKLARVDINKGTAIDLEVPAKLWLDQYQSAVVRDGKFYIALSPLTTEGGHVYIFDIASESPKGVQGAKLVGTGAEQYFIGIY